MSTGERVTVKKIPRNRGVTSAVAKERMEKVVALEERAKNGGEFSESDLILMRNVLHLPQSGDNDQLRERVGKIIVGLDREGLDSLRQKWSGQFWEALDDTPGKGDGRGWLASKILGKREDKEREHKEYLRQLRAGQVEIPKDLAKHLEEAKGTVASYSESAAMVVGSEDIMERIAVSVKYWVERDEAFRAQWDTVSRGQPPPQVFILKGSMHGTGKTMTAEAAMHNATAEAAKKNLPIWAHPIDAHKTIVGFRGDSEQNLARAFDDAFDHPSIIFMDSAQGIARTSTNELGDALENSAAGRMNDTLIKKLREMKEKNSIVILTTNEFGSISEQVRQQAAAGTFDFDRPVNHALLVKVAKRNLDRYRIDNMGPEDVVEIIENKASAIGKAAVTPGDISNACRMVIGKKMEAVYKTLKESKQGGIAAYQQPIAVSLQDFKDLDIAKLKEYTDGDKSKELQGIVTRVKPKLRLEDVGGLDKAKYALYKDVRRALKPNDKKGSKPVHGILLHGPPGTGKTYLTKAVCGELAAGGEVDPEIFIINGAQLFNKWLGETERMIRELFDEARKSAPAIIFIDEIEALAHSRDMGNNVTLGAVNTLLNEMDGTKPLERVVVIGTTNRLDLVDEGFKRPGRFDRIIAIELPKNDAERMEIVTVHLKKAKGFAEAGVTPNAVMELFEKRAFSPAAIERIVNDAIDLRDNEISATQEFSRMPYDTGSGAFIEKWKAYKDELARLHKNLGLPGEVPRSPQEVSLELMERMRGVTEDNYMLKMLHFKEGIAMMQNDYIDEIRRMMEALHTPAAIGKVYGLAALPDGRGGGPAAEGAMLVVECNHDAYSKAGATVIGSEADESIEASANHGREFLKSQAEGALRNYEFSIEVVTATKGADQKTIQGPSAGAAITLAEYSSVTGIKVLPNVVVTGGITMRGEMFKVGGLDYRGFGKIIAAKNIKGVDTMVVPKANYDDFAAEEIAALAKQGLKIVPAETFWDVAKAALETHPDEQEAVAKLRESAQAAEEKEMVRRLKEEEHIRALRRDGTT